MRAALTQAYAGATANDGGPIDMPFGCVVVDDAGKIVSAAHSLEVTNRCPLHHAEMLAIEIACTAVGRVDLSGYTLYTTHESCAMCANGALHASLTRIVYGSARADLPEHFRPKQNALDWLVRTSSQQPEVIGGVMREECIALLVAHFENAKAELARVCSLPPALSKEEHELLLPDR